jgi:chromosome segregation ATPase
MSTVDMLPVKFSVADSAIEKLRDECTGLVAYDDVRKAISTCVGLRSEIEKTRVALKADALAWGRKVDDEAKRLTSMIEAIEEPLRIKKKKVDDAKEAERIARENAIKAKEEADRQAAIAKEEAERKAIRDAEETRLKVERERLAEVEKQQAAERAKIEEQQRIERERLAKIEAEQQAEREKIEADKRAIEAERQRLERIEFERVAKEKAEIEAKEQFERKERERIEAEKAAKVAAEKAAKEKADREEKARLKKEAAKPDVQKIKDFAAVLSSLSLPVVKSEEAKQFVAGVDLSLNVIIEKCNEFEI